MSRPVILPSGNAINPRFILSVSTEPHKEVITLYVVEVRVREDGIHTESEGDEIDMDVLRDAIIDEWREALAGD